MTVDVLIVFPHKSSFIDQDIEILRGRFDVATLEYRRRADRFRLAPALLRTRVALAWFILGYAYEIVRLAPLRRVKTVLIPGGWDVEALPTLGYGAMLSRRAAGRTSYSLARADRVLAVSNHTLGRVLAWTPRARADVVYHGFDHNRFVPGTQERRGVLTVARVTEGTWRLKGLDTFTKLAQRMPDIPFEIVGKVDAGFMSGIKLPPNLTCLGEVAQDELIRSYQSAAVYAQLSAVESFGCSMAEAMLCGCFPVSTASGGLSEVVGGTGLQVPYGNLEATSAAVEQGLHGDIGQAARERIQTLFPLRKRETLLVEEIERLLGARP